MSDTCSIGELSFIRDTNLGWCVEMVGRIPFAPITDKDPASFLKLLSNVCKYPDIPAELTTHINSCLRVAESRTIEEAFKNLANAKRFNDADENNTAIIANDILWTNQFLLKQSCLSYLRQLLANYKQVTDVEASVKVRLNLLISFIKDGDVNLSFQKFTDERKVSYITFNGFVNKEHDTVRNNAIVIEYFPIKLTDN